MKPQHQTKLGYGGNCFAACVASITELPISEVPNFCVDFGRDDWWDVANAWLVQRGWMLVSFYSGVYEALPIGTLVILSGRSPRNPEYNHAVIGRYRGTEEELQKFDFIFDPMPDGKFFTGEIEHVTLVVPIANVNNVRIVHEAIVVTDGLYYFTSKAETYPHQHWRLYSE